MTAMPTEMAKPLRNLLTKTSRSKLCVGEAKRVDTHFYS